MNDIKKFFLDLGRIAKYVYKFGTDDEISRLRVLIVWSFIAIVPSIVIAFTISSWQIHVPGVETGQGASLGLTGLLAGTSVLPILFFITNGLRGYHELFNVTIEKFFNNFEKRSVTSLCTEFGPEEGMRKLRKVDLAKYISAFLLLEFIIIGWATTNYFIFGGNSTSLGLAGYVLDDLLMGAIVLILEGVYSIADGIIESPKVYKLKSIGFFSGDETKGEVTFSHEDSDEVEDPWTE